MIILDTHVWLWWINRDQIRLKPAWIARIDSAESAGVSAISCFEVAWLAHHGRIELPDAGEAWFNKALICPNNLSQSRPHPQAGFLHKSLR